MQELHTIPVIKEIDNYRIVNVEGTKHLATQQPKLGKKNYILKHYKS